MCKYIINKINMKKINIIIAIFLGLISISNANMLTDAADAIASFIGGAITNILLSLATVAFFWSIVQFIWRRNSGKTEGLEDAKNTLAWSTIALFVMFSIWGIVGFFQDALPGFNKNTITAPRVLPSGGSSSGSTGLPSNTTRTTGSVSSQPAAVQNANTTCASGTFYDTRLGGCVVSRSGE